MGGASRRLEPIRCVLLVHDYGVNGGVRGPASIPQEHQVHGDTILVAIVGIMFSGVFVAVTVTAATEAFRAYMIGA